MKTKILVAFATRTGSTREVAEFVGQILRDAGAEVDVRLAREVFDLKWYDSLVLGTAIRRGHALPEAVEFAQRHQAAMQAMPVAYFTQGVAMIQDTPESRQQTQQFIAPLLLAKKPLSLGLFAGRVDHSLLGQPLRFLLSFAKEGPMANGDHRDWNKIRDWAKGLIPLLVQSQPAHDLQLVAAPA